MRKINEIDKIMARIRVKEWARLNPDKVKAHNKRQMEKNHQWLNNYKMSKGCVDCGYNKHHVALELDHVKGVKERRFNGPISMRWLLKELEKCEIRCANCHAIRHYEERRNKI